MGDINIDYLDSRSPSYKSLKYFERVNMLNQYIDSPTRVTQQTSTCLDHIFCNRDEIIASSGSVEVGISDHALVFAQRKLIHTRAKARFIRARLFRKYDPADFRHKLSQLNWTDVLEDRDPNSAWELFKKEFVKICDLVAPYGTIKVRGKLPAWINDDYLSISDARDHAKIKFNRTKSPLDDYVYKTLRNQANTLAHNLKKNFIAESIEANKHNIKKL